MWEYTVATYNNYRLHEELDFRDFLNSFGKIGWELISTEYLENRHVICVFKRKIEIQNLNS
jgi:Domain of unknown function (DUF4177)